MKESSSIFSSFDFRVVTYSHRVDIDVHAMLLFSKSALQLQKYERPSFYSSCFFFFFEFGVYCPLFTQQDIAVLQEHYIGDPGSI